MMPMLRVVSDEYMDGSRSCGCLFVSFNHKQQSKNEKRH